MCSAALLCDTSWSANQELQGSRSLNPDHSEPDKNAIEEPRMNESIPEAIISGDSDVIARMLVREEDIGMTKSTVNVQQVERHDSGVPEDLVSPSCPDETIVVLDQEQREDDDDPNGTINSSGDCNVTVIHVGMTETTKIGENDNDDVDDGTNDFTIMPQENQEIDPAGRDFTPEGKDSKDGSDSGVEGCANELPRVEYASSCNGLDEVSCGSSLVSCCSVYEDPCAIMPDDAQLPSMNASGLGCGAIGGEGTSEGGSESSSLAGSCGRAGKTTGKRSSVASSSSSNVSATLSKRGGKSGETKGGQSSGENSRSSATPRAKIRAGGSSAAGATARASSSSRNASVASRGDRGRSREARSSTREPAGATTSSMTTSTTTTTNADRRGSSSAKLRSSAAGLPTNVTVRTRTRQLPDSLPSSLTTEIDRDLAAQRGRTSVSSKTRGAPASSRGPRGTPASTPCDDTRKSLGAPRTPYVGTRADKTSAASSLDEKALDAYATLPRAKNRGALSLVKSVDRADEIFTRNEINAAKSRENSLSRNGGTKKPRATTNTRDSMIVGKKCLPPYPRTPKCPEKTRIYHEIAVQTGLTGHDIENVLAGGQIPQHDPGNAERLEADTQTDEAWEDLRQVKQRLKIANTEATKLQRDNEKLEAENGKLERLLAEERADHAFARQELDKNARRVLAMLGTPQSEHDEASDSFLELETHFQSSGQVVASQQIEIADLQSLCRMLNRDLEKSLAAQKSLLQQQQELEAESTEMQDFLQEEKATLVDAIKDAEVEIERKNELLTQRDTELARLTEECKHLVRISEQRRQENLSLGMKLNAVERRSRELLLGQGAAVSGAAVALSGLGTRLEGLVDQLVRSYKISEKDLEDVVYHNEAYSRSNSSAESSPISSKQQESLKECTPSPKRGSFVSAVIGAIRNAATHPFATKTMADKKPSPVDTSKYIFKELSVEPSSDLLDFETEPCLMMESVLEDVPLPDTYTHNMVSSSDSLRRALSVPEPIDDANARLPRLNDESTSLTNLTQAILNRRKVEDEEEVGDCDSQSGSEGAGTETNSTAPITDYCPAVNLVDQVIDVDNLVTKLLKVLRIIQLDNDTCIRDLRDDKSELESKLDELRKIAGERFDSDEIFADAVDYRRRTVVENRASSLENETPATSPAEERKSSID